MLNQVCKRHLIAVSVLALVVGIVLTSLLVLEHKADLALMDAMVDSHLLVTNNDGYYHLNLARSFAQGGPASLEAGWDSSLLARVLGSLGGADKFSLMSIGVYVGPVLGLTMLLCLIIWGGVAGSPYIILVGSVLSLLSPYWMQRTHIGVLDTDSIVPFGVYAALYCVMKFSIADTKRWRWAVLYFCIVGLFLLWWKPGVYVCLSLIGCYLIYWPGSRLDAIVKIGLVTILTVIGWVAISGSEYMVGPVDYILTHASMAFGGASQSLLSQAVIELHGISFRELFELSIGTVYLAPFIFIGVILYCIEYRWKSVFLVLAGAVFCGGALASQRFVPLFVPAAAFWAAFAVVYTANFCGKALARKYPVKEVWCVVTLSCLLTPPLLWGAIGKALDFTPEPYFTDSDFALAQTLSDEFPDDTMVWTWWDYGYFIRFFTKMDVFFDGGSQTDLTCYMAAYPLVQDNITVAAGWIKYFSGESANTLDTSNAGESWIPYVESFISDNGIRDVRLNRPVALCLPRRTYDAVGFLYSFANVYKGSIPPIANHLEMFSKKGFGYQPASGSVVVSEEIISRGYNSFGAIVDATGKLPGEFDFTQLSAPYLVYSDNAEFLAVTDLEMINSILFRLLGLFKGNSTLFETVAFDYRSGGIWRVH